MTTAPVQPLVLAIDDDETILALYRDVLNDAGYRVTHHTSAPAPDEVVTLAPDLIVLDLLLGGDALGLDLHVALRRDPRTASIPVVLCSAAHDQVSRLPTEVLGDGVGLVLKPFDLDELLAAVAEGLGRRAEPTARASAAVAAADGG